MKLLDNYAVFTEVARYLSFSEASRRTQLPLPTVSRKIKQIEDDLGVKLFNRSTRSLSITEAGQQLLPKVELLLETFEEIKYQANLIESTPVGTLRITAPALIINYLSEMFSDFFDRYPGIRFDFDTSGTYQNLTKHNFDCAFRVGTLQDSELKAFKIAELQYVLVGSPTLMDSLPAPEHPEELKRWPCIRNHVDGFLIPWLFMNKNESYFPELENFSTSNDLSISVEMALHGTGLIYLSRYIVREHLESGSLVEYLEDWRPQPKDVSLVFSGGDNLPNKLKVFIEVIREHRDTIKTCLK